MLEIKNLQYSINNRTLFDIESLSLERGKHLLLLGQSGCGKTTLLNLLAGLLKPTKGEIIFQDTEYTKLNDTQHDNLRAKNIGFIFQKNHLIPHLTLKQNIAITQLQRNESDLKTLIQTIGLSENTQKKARDLSVGEAQRTAIARALANNPTMIIADEPTSALDDKNTDAVMKLLFSQAEKNNASIIAATHDARIKKYFDKVLEL